MRIRILYFASLRESIGETTQDCDLPDTVKTVGDLRHYLQNKGEPWRSAFADARAARAAVNKVYANDQTVLVEGAEVAFFPPVTGG